MASIHYRDGGAYGYGNSGGYDSHRGNSAAAPSGSGWVQYAGAITSVALILGVVVWGYRLAVRDVTGVPVIRAMQGPARIAPEDPGGDLARHVGLSVNAVAGTGVAAPAPERVALAPEVTGLTDEDTPMADVKLLAEAPKAPAIQELTPTPAAFPVPDMTPAAKPVAEAPVEAPVDADVAALAPEATEPEAPAEVVSVLADAPGLKTSPRPVRRPEVEMSNDALAAALTAEISGKASVMPTVELEPDSLPTGTRLVQLGAFDSPQQARLEWDRVSNRFGALMEGKKRVVQEASSGGRTFYRLRVQGFDDVDDARRFCAALVAESTNCIPALVR
ncbi:SPOR domain-containing protein [Sedimentimonas flavescens]|uniref:SPOR domain-containing protein n=1 Tax=Sedimentimonas flavescens TaxID=2851012 RepID=A0ABT2ZYA9_9RHOB|nr:SPOR domain-containing protein [Sedimentimonas flavescens]MCV2878734.1 SPOR domain-containing protein [Sedimentimonas flavescens]